MSDKRLLTPEDSLETFLTTAFNVSTNPTEDEKKGLISWIDNNDVKIHTIFDGDSKDLNDEQPIRRRIALSPKGHFEDRLKRILKFACMLKHEETLTQDEKKYFHAVFSRSLTEDYKINETSTGSSLIQALLDHYQLNEYLKAQGGSNRRKMKRSTRRTTHRKMRKSLIRRRK